MTENPNVPQSTKETSYNLGCSIEDFIAYGRLGWGNCLARQVQFAGKSKLFTKPYIDGQLAKYDALEAMPTMVQRKASVAIPQQKLLAAAQGIRDMALSLRNDIGFAFEEPALVKAEDELAGVTVFLDKSATDWPSYPSFLTKAAIYLTGKLAYLVEKEVVNDDYLTEFNAKGKIYKDAFTAYKDAAKKADDDKEAQDKLIGEILPPLGFMLKTGRALYKYEPAELENFVKAKLLAKVRGLKPAGLQGKVTKNGKKIPFEGVSVSALVAGEDTERTTLTDAKGNYLLKLPGGTYNFKFRFGGELLHTLSDKKIQGGIKSRFNLALQSPPPQE